MIYNIMDYKKHYNLLIQRANNRDLADYTERHHIIPQCMGGTTHDSNIVRLKPEEHYVAHQLLVKMYPKVDSLVYAANMMTVASKTNPRPTNKVYGWLKRKYASVCRNRIGKNNPSYGKKWYYDPSTSNSGKFLENNVPDGWIKGRCNPNVDRYCKSCSVYVDTIKKRNMKPIYCAECYTNPNPYLHTDEQFKKLYDEHLATNISLRQLASKYGFNQWTVYSYKNRYLEKIKSSNNGV
jgi:hypothetical protein